MSAIHSLVTNAVNGYGPEILDNGEFATGANWTLSADWSIGSGVASYASGGSGKGMYQDVVDPNVVGNTYRVTVTITAGSGKLYFTLVGASLSIVSPDITGVGTHVVDLWFPADRGDLERVRINGAGTASFSIDNVSVRRYYP